MQRLVSPGSRTMLGIGKVVDNMSHEIKNLAERLDDVAGELNLVKSQLDKKFYDWQVPEFPVQFLNCVRHYVGKKMVLFGDLEEEHRMLCPEEENEYRPAGSSRDGPDRRDRLDTDRRPGSLAVHVMNIIADLICIFVRPIFRPETRYRHAFFHIVRTLCAGDADWSFCTLMDNVVESVGRVYSDRGAFSVATMEFHEHLQRFTEFKGMHPRDIYRTPEEFQKVDWSLVNSELRQRTDDFLVYCRSKVAWEDIANEEALEHLHWIVSGVPNFSVFAAEDEEEVSTESTIMTSSAETTRDQLPFKPPLRAYEIPNSEEGTYFLYEPTVLYFNQLAQARGDPNESGLSMLERRFPINVDLYETPEIQSKQAQYVGFNSRQPRFAVVDTEAAIAYAAQLQGGIPNRFRSDPRGLMNSRAEFGILTNRGTRFQFAKVWALVSGNDIERLCPRGAPFSTNSACPEYYRDNCTECMTRSALYDGHGLNTSLWLIFYAAQLLQVARYGRFEATTDNSAAGVNGIVYYKDPLYPGMESNEATDLGLMNETESDLGVNVCLTTGKGVHSRWSFVCKDGASVKFLLKRHGIRFRRSALQNQSDHILVPMSPEEQPAPVEKFERLMQDAVLYFFLKYQRDERLSAEDFFELRRLLNFPEYVQYDDRTETPLRQGVNPVNQTWNTILAAAGNLERGMTDAYEALKFAAESSPRWFNVVNRPDTQRRAHRTYSVKIQNLCFELNFRPLPVKAGVTYTIGGLCKEGYCSGLIQHCLVNQNNRQRFHDVVVGVEIPPPRPELMGYAGTLEALAERFGFGRQRGYRSAIFNAIAAVFPASTLKEIVEYNTFPLLQIVRGERGRNQPRNRVQNARYMGAALCLKAVPGGIIPDMVFAMFEELSGGVLTSEAWRFCTNAEIQRGADRHGVRLAHYDEL